MIFVLLWYNLTMDIPQNILNKFIIREDYLEWIKKETTIFVYIDFSRQYAYIFSL